MSGALFCGWRPDAEGRARFAALQSGLCAARPNGAPTPKLRRPDQWHVTLCFIGDQAERPVSPTLLEACAEAAADVPAHRFDIGRIGYWRGSGAVVALPCECPALQALCDSIHDTILRRGIRPHQATTQPHLTLAYFERHLPAQTWLDRVDCSGDSLSVESFELLLSSGGRYAPLAEWPLTGAGLPSPPTQASLF